MDLSNKFYVGGLLVLVILVYFLPTIVGFKKRNVLGIFILNLFLGVTGVGWVIALVWAVKKNEGNSTNL